MAMKAGVPGTLRRKIFKRDNYTCQHCGLKGWEVKWKSGSYTYPTVFDGVYLSIDHIKPRSKGGSVKDPKNLRVFCTRCNSEKGNKLDGQWERGITFWGELNGAHS